MAVYTDLIRYRELFANLFRRDLQAKYRGSVLGVVWSLALPLLLMGAYVLVFSLVLPVVGDIDDYALFLLSGLATWLFFATSLQAASRSIVDNANLVKRVRFPRQLVPLSIVGTHLVTLGRDAGRARRRQRDRPARDARHRASSPSRSPRSSSRWSAGCRSRSPA